MRTTGLIAACAIMLLSGCAEVPRHPSLEERSGIRRVAVLPDPVPPKTNFDTFAIGAGDGPAKGAAGGALYTIGAGAATGDPIGLLVGIALAPVGAIIGGLGGTIAAVPPDRAQQIEALQSQWLARLAVQQRLSEEVIKAGGASGYTLAPAPAAADAILETNAVEFGFTGSGHDPTVALYMTAKARLTRADSGAPLGEKTFRSQSEERTLNEWLDDGGKPLQAAFDTVVRQLAKDIVEGHLLHYPFGTVPGAERMVFGPAPTEPGRVDLAWLPIPTLDSLKPTLSWEAFKAPDTTADPAGGLARATNLGYEICVWKHGGEGHESPGECVYQRKGLKETSHPLGEPLPAGQRYLWSVRLRFQVDGSEYLSAWNPRAHIFETPSPEPTAAR